MHVNDTRCILSAGASVHYDPKKLIVIHWVGAAHCPLWCGVIGDLKRRSSDCLANLGLKGPNSGDSWQVCQERASFAVLMNGP